MAKYSKSPFRLFKRGETWHAYFSVVANGRRIVVRETTGCQNEDDAKAWCAERINKIINAPALTHEITLDTAAEKWWQEVGQYQARPEGVFSRIKNLLMDMEPSVLLSCISKSDINEFITISTAKHRSNATINRYLSLLSAICTRAKEYWECNTPTFRILQFKKSEPRENIKYFRSMDDVQKIVDNAAPHVRPIIWTALYTGIRLGRILTLKWEQIDWDNNQIIYMGKDGQPHAKPIVEPLQQILKELPYTNEYVFVYHGHRIRSINKAWKRAFERADIPYLNFHALRHTTATWLLRKTQNIKVVQKALDHHSLNTTTRYAHLIDNETQDALNSLFQ